MSTCALISRSLVTGAKGLLCLPVQGLGGWGWGEPCRSVTAPARAAEAGEQASGDGGSARARGGGAGQTGRGSPSQNLAFVGWALWGADDEQACACPHGAHTLTRDASCEQAGLKHVVRAVAECEQWGRGKGARAHSSQALAHLTLRVKDSVPGKASPGGTAPRRPADTRGLWRGRLSRLPGTVLYCKVSCVTLSAPLGFNLYWFAKALLTFLHNKRFGETGFTASFVSAVRQVMVIRSGATHLVPLPWALTPRGHDGSLGQAGGHRCIQGRECCRPGWWPCLGAERASGWARPGRDLREGPGEAAGVQGSQPRGQLGEDGHVAERAHGAAPGSRQGVRELRWAADATAQTLGLQGLGRAGA